MGRCEIPRGRRASALVLSLACVVAACGGGGGSAPPPAPANRAPAFSSAATAAVAENVTATIYTPAATDPDGDAVTITISGGADAAAFNLSGGALALVRALNFDQPTDADLNNVYVVTLAATDSKGAVSTLALSVAVTNDKEGVNLTRVGSGFGSDAVLAARTQGSGLLLVSQDGTARQIDAASGAASVVGNVFKPGESGRVLAVAHFNRFGVAMLDVGTRGVIVRTIPLPDSTVQSVVEAVLAPGPSRAARGALFIGGDGFLFGALEDTTGSQAQDPASRYGKFYRVQLDPFCGASLLGAVCIFTELFGDGVHAPAGGGGYSGQTFLLDRGTDRQEEVTYFDENASPLDFGWPFREGTFERVANPPAAINGPSITYAHGSGFFEGRGLTGGLFYSGPIASLAGRVIVTDQAGKVFAFPATFLADGILHAAREMENRTADFTPAGGVIERPVAIVRDLSGRLFVLDGDGELFATS